MSNTNLPAITWTAEDTFSVNETEFVCRPMDRRFRSTANRFCLVKPPWAIPMLVELLSEAAPSRVVELGIYEGGSAALLCELVRPEKLVAIDIRTARSAGLDEFASHHGALALHYGIDQSDGERLRKVVDRERGERLLDLVIDDASHLVEPTRRSFNVLFPLLTENGRYVIEDWNWYHYPYAAIEGKTSLAAFVIELLLVAAARPDVISGISVNQAWAVIRRGPAKLVPGEFDVSALHDDKTRALLPVGQ